MCPYTWSDRQADLIWCSSCAVSESKGYFAINFSFPSFLISTIIKNSGMLNASKINCAHWRQWLKWQKAPLNDCTSHCKISFFKRLLEPLKRCPSACFYECRIWEPSDVLLNVVHNFHEINYLVQIITESRFIHMNIIWITHIFLYSSVLRKK